MKPVDMLGLQIKEEILRKLIYDFVFKIRVFELRCICVIYRPGGRGGGRGKECVYRLCDNNYEKKKQRI